jgi:hypothetical protein
MVGRFLKIARYTARGATFRLKVIEMVKPDLDAGKMTDWGSFSNGKDGYAIIEGSEDDVFATMYKFMPVISYEVFPVLSADQYVEGIKRGVAEMPGQ